MLGKYEFVLNYCKLKGASKNVEKQELMSNFFYNLVTTLNKSKSWQLKRQFLLSNTQLVYM